MTVEIRGDDVTDPRVIDLIRRHLRHSRSHSPETSIHTLELDAMRAPDVDVFTMWEGATVLATGALKTLSDTQGEVKSMHVSEEARGRGLGRQMLAHLEAHALDLGMTRLWLETGSMRAYAPARALYASYGFAECAPFADYVLDPNSVFMTKPLI